MMKLGLVGVGLSVLWWYIFYSKVNSAIGGGKGAMGEAVRCLYSKSGPCGFISGFASAAGEFA